LSKTLQKPSSDAESLRKAVRFFSEINAMLYELVTQVNHSSAEQLITLLILHSQWTSDFLEDNFPEKKRSLVDGFKLIGDETTSYILGFLSPMEIAPISATSKGLQTLCANLMYSFPYMFRFGDMGFRCFVIHNHSPFLCDVVEDPFDGELTPRLEKLIENVTDVSFMVRFSLSMVWKFAYDGFFRRKKLRKVKKLMIHAQDIGYIPDVSEILRDNSDSITSFECFLGVQELGTNDSLFLQVGQLSNLSRFECKIRFENPDRLSSDVLDGKLSDQLRNFRDAFNERRIDAELMISGLSNIIIKNASKNFYFCD
jgi:hypothetical protein